VQDIHKKVENEEAEAIENPPINESEGPVQEGEKPENAPSTDENSSHLGDVDDTRAVVAAAKWVQKVHKVSTLDSLWYERL
jgi:hypothetical protein